MTHYPETPWNLTPRQQTAMEAFVQHGAVKKAASAMDANENTVAELLRQARARMNASSLTMAALMWDRYKRPTASQMDDWVHTRVTKGQAEWVRKQGGSQFLRGLIGGSCPKRLDDVWRTA
jgi:DNA-binding CsgD family transcriptional regulator